MSAFDQIGSTLRRTLALFAALLIAALGGCAARQAAFPTGTFTTTIPTEAIAGNDVLANLVGDWQLSFTEEGTYTLVNKGIDIVRGSYAVDGDPITFTQEDGLFVMPGTNEQVSYTWLLEQEALRFSPLDDAVGERALVMSNQPWTRAP